MAVFFSKTSHSYSRKFIFKERVLIMKNKLINIAVNKHLTIDSREVAKMLKEEYGVSSIKNIK